MEQEAMKQSDEGRARILGAAADLLDEIAEEHGEIDNPADELHGHRCSKAAELLRKESERFAQTKLF